jgi:alkylation response protein AidB-like acyl-CoA dehydrogenase
MRFLEAERVVLEKLLPGLDARLAALPLAELERAGSPAIAMFRAAGGAGLLIPQSQCGLGASALTALAVHRALGARSPSLAVAVAMHNFSVATIVAYGLWGQEGEQLLRAVAEQRLLIASGFAEGRTGQGILDGAMEARAVPGGYRVRGSKKPCSLAHSMDLLTAGVRVVDLEGGSRRAVAVVPAASEGLSRRPFWRSFVLAGAESDEVVLDDVLLPESLLFFPQTERGLDEAEVAGFVWFELLISAGYLGAASGLFERVLASGRASAADQLDIATDLEGAALALRGAAQALEGGARPDLAAALFARYATQAALQRAAAHSAELLGGMDFVRGPDVAYLLASCRALAFHPPSRSRMAPGVGELLAGGEIRIS